jgi:hypothetical protein
MGANHMSAPVLYINRKGYPVTTHSYSGGETFRSCKRKYKLQRLDGYVEKARRASKEFGVCIVDAIAFFHVGGKVPGSSVQEFELRWEKRKEQTDLQYTDKEGSWEDLLQMGRDLLRLYEIKLPSLPWANDAPKFQLNYRKEVFPGTYLGGINFTAFIDLRCKVTDPPPTVWNPAAEPYPLIVDIKTAAGTLDETMVALDPQLRAYSWVAGTPDVAFLWLVKARPGMKKGDRVTLLADTKNHKAGETVLFFTTVDTPAISIDHVIFDQQQYDAYEKESAGLRGKALDKVKEKYTQIGDWVPADYATKCKLQFAAAHISVEDMREAGEAIGAEIAEIHMANEKGWWPKEPGVRWPNDKCKYCALRGNCLGHKELRDTLVIRMDEDWLDKLEAEDAA